jgi:hypothetical protein
MRAAELIGSFVLSAEDTYAAIGLCSDPLVQKEGVRRHKVSI